MSAEHDARERLRERYNANGAHLKPGEHPLGTAGDAAYAVCMALWIHTEYAKQYPDDREMREHYPEPTRDDVLDALAQIVDYRASVDDEERKLITAARELGVEWEEIGEALGYPTRSAKQSARARASSLARSSKTRASRYVRRRPLVTEQPAGGGQS